MTTRKASLTRQQLAGEIDKLLRGDKPYHMDDILHLIDEYVATLIPDKRPDRKTDSEDMEADAYVDGIVGGHNDCIDEISRHAGIGGES